jgi:hypothetical protein
MSRIDIQLGTNHKSRSCKTIMKNFSIFAACVFVIYRHNSLKIKWPTLTLKIGKRIKISFIGSAAGLKHLFHYFDFLALFEDIKRRVQSFSLASHTSRASTSPSPTRPRPTWTRSGCTQLRNMRKKICLFNKK